jgi:Zn-dependent protease with chaperone function
MMPLALSACALLLIAYGSYRVIAIQRLTSRIVSRWLEGARPSDAAVEPVIFCSQPETPPFTLVGVRKPKVLVSESIVALLSRDEFQMALKHEYAHTQSHDNLKKLTLRFCSFPGMATLERAWSEAAELAADDSAVSNMKDAVDLAAALVKLSRSVPVDATPICTTSLATGCIQSRVLRLLVWNEASEAQPARVHPRWAILFVGTALLSVVVTYAPTLALTHEFTEWLVR